MSLSHSLVGNHLSFGSCRSPPAGNESCPQPQTSEHLAAIEIMKLKHILILQNKIDLVKESQAKEQYEQILAFVQGESEQTCAPKKRGNHCSKSKVAKCPSQERYRMKLPSKKPCILEVCVTRHLLDPVHLSPV